MYIFAMQLKCLTTFTKHFANFFIIIFICHAVKVHVNYFLGSMYNPCHAVKVPGNFTMQLAQDTYNCKSHIPEVGNETTPTALYLALWLAKVPRIMWICIGVLYGQIVLPKPEIDAASHSRQPPTTNHPRPPSTALAIPQL